MIGRPCAFGLAAHGIDGVRGVVDIFERELRIVMSMLGVARVANFDESLVRRIPA